MKTLYSFAFTLLFVGFTQAQSDWVLGSVVLKTNKVLVGEISKKPIHELIVVKNSDGVTALPAHQVAYYRFYDEENNINRQYLSIKANDLFRSSKFFEIVIQGNVKVLRKYHKKTLESKLDEAYDFDYFAFIENTLIPLSHFKKSVFPKLMQKYPTEISAFVSAKQLQLASVESAFLIIKQFNSIDRHLNLLAQID